MASLRERKQARTSFLNCRVVIPPMLKGTALPVMLCLLAVLVWVRPAQALVLYSQTNYSNFDNYPTGSGHIYQDLGSGLSGIVESITLAFSDSEFDSESVEVSLVCANGTATSSIDYFSYIWMDESLGDSPVFFTATSTGVDLSDCNKHVFLAIDVGGNWPTVYGTSASTYSGGNAYNSDGTLGLADLFFSLSNLYQGPEQVDEYLMFTSPENMATTTSPVTISLNGRYESNVYDFVSVRVNIMPTSIFASTTPYEIVFDTIPQGETWSRSYDLTLPDGSYQAKAIYETEDNSSLIFIDMINFGVGDVGITEMPLGEWESEQIATDRCSNFSDSSWYAYYTAGALCKLASYLFISGNTFANEASQVKNLISTKFPFNLFNRFNEEFQAVQGTATTTTTITMDLGVATSSFMLLNVNWFDSWPIFSTIRSILVMLLYFVFVILLIARIEHIV